jgi:hypothetical protein
MVGAPPGAYRCHAAAAEVPGRHGSDEAARFPIELIAAIPCRRHSEDPAFILKRPLNAIGLLTFR